MTARDSQKARVYAAERAAFPGFSDPEFDTVAECQRFLDSITRQKIVQRRFNYLRWLPRAGVIPPPVVILPGTWGQRAALSFGRTIRLPRWARSGPVILHELAHSVTAGPPHGWRFCEAYLWLVRRAYGRTAHDRLRAEFKAKGVRYTKPRAPLSPERKAELAARVAAYRFQPAATRKAEP